MNTSSQDERKWASVFIEVALRAVRRVHYEYGLWGIGPQWKMNRQLAQRINTGQGVELAPETDVCAAITQEFIGSPAVSGLWSEEANGVPGVEVRYFMIDREAKYLSQPRKRVDIFVQKYVPKGGKLGEELEPVELPSFIEAKRARIWTPEIKTGEARHLKNQLEDVRKDVKKLKKEINHRTTNGLERILGHVLVWGVQDQGAYSDSPVKFFNAVDGVELHTLRWLPIQWRQPSRAELTDESLPFPEVQAAVWIGLAEVQ